MEKRCKVKLNWNIGDEETPLKKRRIEKDAIVTIHDNSSSSLETVHADGQYQANTFQDKFLELLGAYHQPDPYFLLLWDVSHWMDIVMVHLREDSDSSKFLTCLIK
ncbi:Hypothetical predicted protein [Paramuricea clavata]|uniref:Uncharacterized protein n=1 Tax=Paramuricea clavata TaxID=317549 RepID=A0A6S7GUD1_PARCT|nr:Hypothetical predicted protein [Paramuricea clavata]